MTTKHEEPIIQKVQAGNVIDPVCAREIEPDTAAATLEYDGDRYWFCSQECAEGFDADPESFLYPPSEPQSPSR